MYSETDNNPASKVVPDKTSNLSKKQQVADMFDNIAGKYDFLNHFLSLGIDNIWRKKAIAEIAKVNPKVILDVATGTGDLAVAATKINPDKIIGVDISNGMLDIGRLKIKEKSLSDKIELRVGDSEHLNFDDNTFDAITCAYGVRNFENLTAGLKEMHRVMAAGGKLAILEFSHPKKFPIKQGYNFYFKYILPNVGKLFSKHQTAYSYLPDSVMAFPEGAAFCKILTEVGFKEVKAQPLTLGITTLYTAIK